MNTLERALARIVDEMRVTSYPFALVGGLAVSARAEPRLTRDADVAVTVADDAAAEQLIRHLQTRGYTPGVLVEQEAKGRLATVRLSSDADHGLLVDLLFASSGIEPEIVDGATVLQVTPTVAMPVASTGHLIATKLLARDDRRRPTDADDLAALSAVATPADWVVAEGAVGLIEQRGFHRDRDLRQALTELRQSGAY